MLRNRSVLDTNLKNEYHDVLTKCVTLAARGYHNFVEIHIFPFFNIKRNTEQAIFDVEKR